MGQFPWYALSVKGNCERFVATNLAQKGYEVFLPSYTVTRRWSDRMKSVECPLFPGYVFCRLDLEHRVPVLSTTSVRSIVGAGKRAMPVSENELLAVRKIVESGLPFSACAYFRVGQRVYLNEGPLAGVDGIIAAFKSSSRLVVSVDLLQRSVMVEIDPSWVEPAEADGSWKMRGAGAQVITASAAWQERKAV
jgi:transcription antitermination factor NusG